MLIEMALVRHIASDVNGGSCGLRKYYSSLLRSCLAAERSERMKHEKETWTWELKLILNYIAIIVVGCVLAGLLGGKGFWENELVNMREPGSFAIVCFAWIVAIPIGGILLRRYFFCWSPQAKRYDREKAEHRERMKRYFDA